MLPVHPLHPRRARRVETRRAPWLGTFHISRWPWLPLSPRPTARGLRGGFGGSEISPVARPGPRGSCGQPGWGWPTRRHSAPQTPSLSSPRGCAGTSHSSTRLPGPVPLASAGTSAFCPPSTHLRPWDPPPLGPEPLGPPQEVGCPAHSASHTLWEARPAEVTVYFKCL